MCAQRRARTHTHTHTYTHTHTHTRCSRQHQQLKEHTQAADSLASEKTTNPQSHNMYRVGYDTVSLSVTYQQHGDLVETDQRSRQRLSAQTPLPCSSRCSRRSPAVRLINFRLEVNSSVFPEQRACSFTKCIFLKSLLDGRLLFSGGFGLLDMFLTVLVYLQVNAASCSLFVGGVTGRSWATGQGALR